MCDRGRHDGSRFSWDRLGLDVFHFWSTQGLDVSIRGCIIEAFGRLSVTDIFILGYGSRFWVGNSDLGGYWVGKYEISRLHAVGHRALVWVICIVQN